MAAYSCPCSWRRRPGAPHASLDQIQGGFGGEIRVGGVRVGADLARVARAQRGAADQHLHVPAVTERTDRDLHLGQRGGKEGRQADDVRIGIARGLREGFGPDVDTKVDHAEARTLHAHLDQVLADVVDVALDGAQDHGAQGRPHLARGTCWP